MSKLFNRAAHAALALLLVIFLCPRAGAATPAQEARQTLSDAVNRIMEEIKSPAFANPAERGAVKSRIEREVYGIFNFDEFSSRTVGPRWRNFTPQDKKSFSDAFANLLFNTYLNKITGYNGEQVSYVGEKVSPQGNQVEVQTILNFSDGKRTPVNYRMIYKDGRWSVYDVIIENISLVRNYRTQFQDILKSATPAQLIERINQKAKEVIAQGASGK